MDNTFTDINDKVLCNLSPRLEMIARLLGRGDVICDIGCDHGYLPIALISLGAYHLGIAMDINTGPLERAKDNIDKAGLSDSIKTRLSDGVSALKPYEADAVSICGMGGNVIMHIFDEGQDILAYIDTIVISPQSEYMMLRLYLLRKGYTIIEEDIIRDSGKYYFAWKLAYSGNALPNEAPLAYNKLSFHYSEYLCARHNKIYLDYLKSSYDRIDKAINNIKSNSMGSNRLDGLYRERQMIQDIVSNYERGLCNNDSSTSNR